MIVVSGRLQIREWTDKNGAKRRNAEITAERAYFGEGKRDQAQGFVNLPDDTEVPF
jgi:single-strand DNA-binding protein